MGNHHVHKATKFREDLIMFVNLVPKIPCRKKPLPSKFKFFPTQIKEVWGAVGLAPLLGKPKFLKNGGRYQKIVLSDLKRDIQATSYPNLKI